MRLPRGSGEVCRTRATVNNSLQTGKQGGQTHSNSFTGVDPNSGCVRAQFFWPPRGFLGKDGKSRWRPLTDFLSDAWDISRKEMAGDGPARVVHPGRAAPNLSVSPMMCEEKQKGSG